jgi:hypothetical protein
MEVHAHAHTPRKNGHIISKFLMLFLAVTLGFLENQREHYIEKQGQRFSLIETESRHK